MTEDSTKGNPRQDTGRPGLRPRGPHGFFTLSFHEFLLWSILQPPNLQGALLLLSRSTELLVEAVAPIVYLIIMGRSTGIFSGAMIVTVITVNPLFLDFRKPTQKRRFSCSWSSPGTLEYICMAAACVYLLKNGVAWGCVSLPALAPPSRETMKLR